ncbi:GxxExxY protein [Candidatus Uhrbacteria bacterium]|nr:GxxExxY protein [Candidatus Uhrbacteria bacterium]
MGGIRNTNVVYPELSYTISGILFEVRRQLDSGYHEKHVQRAVAVALSDAHIRFQEQCPAVIEFRNRVIGRYFLDFVIDGKIVLELKVLEKPSRKDFDQIKQYLSKTKLALGLLAVFGRNGVTIYRVLAATNGS